MTDRALPDGSVEDPVAGVDAMVARIGPGLGRPAVGRRDVVLVIGPWLSGATGVAAALRERIPERIFVEAGELAPGEAPVAVVFVVSAVAVMTESDCALIDSAVADTDLVIGAVSKIDVQRKWRDVLAADRDMLATHAGRYHDMPWVGVAAAPDLGDPRVEELVTVVRRGLADPGLVRRNRLRAWESRLASASRRYDQEVDGAGRRARVATLRERRSTAVRQQRLTKSERIIALRSQIQQARVQLSYFARNRCSSVRAELQEDAAGMTRRKLPEFEGYLRSRVDDVVAEVNEGVARHLADVAYELGLPAAGLVNRSSPPPPPEPARPELPGPPLKSRRLETRLTLLLGAGFGLGVALTLSRLFAGLAPGLTVVGTVACVLVGLAVTVWVVGTRGLLHDRAVLDRWVSEVAVSLRSVVDQLVASRVLAAESMLTADLSDRDEAEAAVVAEQVGAIDTELREHAVVAARAAAMRDREMPTLQLAMEAVRRELGQPATNGHAVPSDVSTVSSRESPD